MPFPWYLFEKMGKSVMDIQLVVTTGSKAGRAIKVKTPKFSIGQSSKCHLQIGGSSVAPHHCTILNEEGYAGVEDKGAPGGTFVNDERVEGKRELKNGDKLRIGSTMTFEIRLTVGVSGDKKPKVTSISEAAARAARKKPPKPTDDDDIDLFAIFGETAPTEDELPDFATRKKRVVEEEEAKEPEDALAREKREQEVTRSAASDTIDAILNQKKIGE